MGSTEQHSHDGRDRWSYRLIVIDVCWQHGQQQHVRRLDVYIGRGGRFYRGHHSIDHARSIDADQHSDACDKHGNDEYQHVIR